MELEVGKLKTVDVIGGEGEGAWGVGELKPNSTAGHVRHRTVQWKLPCPCQLNICTCTPYHRQI